MKSVKVNGLIKKQISDTEYRFYNELGELHRTDGPAIVAEDFESWYFEGYLHRVDGPAFVSKSAGALSRGIENKWAIMGILVKERDFEELALKFKLDRLKDL